MKTPISSIGEFGLIKRIAEKVNLYNKNTIKGIGDDTAVIDISDNKYLLFTTDLLIEGIHFNLVYTPLKHLGYKAVAVNLSDIAAMNGQPTHILVSIALSSKFTIELIDELYEGIKIACNKYNVDLVGGDTSSSITGMMISISAIGFVDKNKITYRNTAKVNDFICVTGDLGAAFFGLKFLEREYILYEEFLKENKEKEFQPDFKGYEYLLKRQLKPEPRLDIIRFFYDNDIQPTSMIDISDGLSSELHHICFQSGVGCRIYQHKIPIAEEVYKASEEFNIAPETAALNGGEDYELLFTISEKDLHKVLYSKDISVIGQICPNTEGLHMITQQGNKIELLAQGWIHFK